MNAFETSAIANKCRSLSINYEEIENIKRAIKYINNSNEKIFLITGSLYLVGKIRKYFINST